MLLLLGLVPLLINNVEAFFSHQPPQGIKKLFTSSISCKEGLSVDRRLSSASSSKPSRLRAATGGENHSPPQVLCYGEALVDRLGPLGGDPATDLPVDDRLGGAPANVCCGLARLGTSAAFLGRLGQDAIGPSVGDSFKHVFAERQVNTQALQWDDVRPSRIVLVRRDANGDREFGGFAGDKGQGFADQAVNPTLLGPATSSLLDQAQWLLVGTLPLASAVSASALHEAVKGAKSKGVPLALDINWRPTFWSGSHHPADGPPPMAIDKIKPLLEEAALIKFAAEEAQWLFQTTDPIQIQKMLDHNPAIIVTDGEGKLKWSIGQSVGSRAAFHVEAVDTTGAGDAFVAGLLHQFCREKRLLKDAERGGEGARRIEEVMAYACACGAIVCQGAGAIDPQPTEEQILTFLRKHHAIAA